MVCRKCGDIVPAGSKFCANCGTPVRASRETGPTRPPKKLAIGAIIAALAVLLLLAFLALHLSHGKVMDADSPVVPPKSPVLSAESPKPAPEKTPPADIVAYIDHVRKIEARRGDMRVDLTPAFALMGKANSMREDAEEESRDEKKHDISNGLDAYTQKWQQLVQDFNAVRPPSGCEQLAGSYGTALGQYSKIMIQIETALSKQDLGALMAMQGNAQSAVDTCLVQADGDLTKVCDTWGISKDFSITPDRGVESLFSPTPTPKK
jgi:hypothetical protein